MSKQTGIEKQLTDFLEYLELEKGRSQRTLQNYDFYLRRFLSWARFPSPKDITLPLVRSFRQHINRSIEGQNAISKRLLRKKSSWQNSPIVTLNFWRRRNFYACSMRPKVKMWWLCATERFWNCCFLRDCAYRRRRSLTLIKSI